MTVTYGEWHKSTKSDAGSNCLEWAAASDGGIGIRDSKDKDGPVLHVSITAWRNFVEGVRTGEIARSSNATS